MEKETPYKRDDLLKWTVAEFNTEFAYLAWHNYFMDKYQEILKASKKDK